MLNLLKKIFSEIKLTIKEIIDKKGKKIYQNITKMFTYRQLGEFSPNIFSQI